MSSHPPGRRTWFCSHCNGCSPAWCSVHLPGIASALAYLRAIHAISSFPAAMLRCRRRELSQLLSAGAKRLVPEAWRKWPLFDNIFRLKGVPVITVQLRYDGWITELKDQSKMQDLSHVSPLRVTPPQSNSPKTLLFLIICCSLCIAPQLVNSFLRHKWREPSCVDHNFAMIQGWLGSWNGCKECLQISRSG